MIFNENTLSLNLIAIGLKTRKLQLEGRKSTKEAKTECVFTEIAVSCLENN